MSSYVFTCLMFDCRRFSVYEKLFETSDILSDLYMIYGGHFYTFGGHLAYLLCVFSVFLSDIMSDVSRENVGHGVQNVGHVRTSDYFSYTLAFVNYVSMRPSFKDTILYEHLSSIKIRFKGCLK